MSFQFEAPRLTSREITEGVTHLEVEDGLFQVSVPTRDPGEPLTILDGLFGLHESGAYVEQTVEIPDTTILHEGAVIGRGVKLRPGVEIGRRTVIKDRTYLYGRVSIGEDCVVGRKSEISDGARIDDGSYLGNRVLIPRLGFYVPAGSYIGSRQIVTSYPSEDRSIPFDLPTIETYRY